MKSLFKFGALFLLLAATLTASAQTFNFSAFGSTNKTNLVGATVSHVSKSGLVLGLEGTHAAHTFFSSEIYQGNDFRDKNYTLASLVPGLKPYGSFTENRGTVAAVLGYELKSTVLTADVGICFQQVVTLFTSAPFNATNTYAPGALGYQTRGTSQFAYGATLHQYFNKVGVLVGYSNVGNLKLGLSYRIAASK